MTEQRDMTITEFEDLIDKAYDLKLEAEDLDEKKKEKHKELEEINKILLAEFERLDKTSYGGRRCQVIKVQRSTVTTPKDPESRAAFFDYLKKKRVFAELVTVNHQTLNAFYKNEFESAVEAGNHEFKIPGLEDPKIFEHITFRKK